MGKALRDLYSDGLATIASDIPPLRNCEPDVDV